MARKRRDKERVDRFVELKIDSIAFEGVAVGRSDGLVHFVKGALPGESVRARVTKSKKSYVEAEAVEIFEASPDRIDPPCPHFGACGGCKWQHFEYAQQIVWKHQHLIDAFERIGKVEVGTITDTIACPQPFGYRNKMEFSFGAWRWLTNDEIDSGEEYDTRFALGLHVPGRFDKVRDIEHCLLQTDVPNQILKWTHDLRREMPVSAHHQRSHQGFLRNLVIRSSVTTGAVMTVLITDAPSDEDETRFVERWMEIFATLPEGSTAMHAVNATRSPVAAGNIERSEGPGYLVETSHDVEYRISPFSFFQTNTVQLPALVTAALDAAAITSDDTVWDLYCGTGTLALPAARLAKHVVGAELVESSIADAKDNANRNDIENVEFHAVDLHAKGAIDVLREYPTPDVVIVDPPRAGIHPALVEHLLEVAAPRIAYVSCNPTTLARDCAVLAEKYDIEEVVPVDMFPQTFHVEAVARLRLRD